MYNGDKVIFKNVVIVIWALVFVLLFQYRIWNSFFSEGLKEWHLKDN